MSTASLNYDTICAVATCTASPSGVALIRISGPEAIAVTQRLWKGRQLMEIQPRTATLGTVTDISGEPIDQVLLTKFTAPASFTGEDTVEIATHGSLWVQQLLISSLVQAGARPAEPGEFTRRAYMNRRIDLAQAEAVADLIDARSKASARLALNQMRGHLSHSLDSLRQDLMELTALLELELDFADQEDVKFADRIQLIERTRHIQNQCTSLAATFAQGEAIRNGVPVAIIGAPNVGKSTILNILCRHDRAITSPIPGTTRDTIEETLTIGGTLYRLIDTAGIRTTDDPVENLGIERARKAASQASIIIHILSPDTTPLSRLSGYIHTNSYLSEDSHNIVVLNKADLLTCEQATEWEQQLQTHMPGSKIILISAIDRGSALPALETAIKGSTAEITDSDSVIITNGRHHAALLKAADSAAQAAGALEEGIPADLVAQHLRSTIHHLGTITGAITTPAILQTIFSRFCIGK